ncbi:hypothetical protein L1887_62104 [Cichorium endivia]|nr:hypothetical protein L1887_62104 [Cichorium endivia]
MREPNEESEEDPTVTRREVADASRPRLCLRVMKRLCEQLCAINVGQALEGEQLVVVDGAGAAGAAASSWARVGATGQMGEGEGEGAQKDLRDAGARGPGCARLS